MTWTNPELETLGQVVARRTGLTFSPARIDSAEQGMRRAMARAAESDAARYRRLVETSSAAFDDLVNELTVGETYFFRDPEQFAWIRQHWVADVFQRRGANGPVRIWSAGCASGEEIYSLAIVCREAGLADRVRCLATDISRTALAKARRGVYGPWSLRGAGKPWIEPYLTRQANSHVVDEQIRRSVSFSYLNLAQDSYPSLPAGFWDLDLILCRNVLIYLNPESIRQVARRLFDALAPGGWLLTAPSDPPLMEAAPFETVMTPAGVAYRRPAAAHQRVPPPEPMPTIVVPPAPVVVESPPLLRAAAPPPEERAAAAASALARGDYAQVAALTSDASADASLCSLRIRALASHDLAQAERECRAATARHPQAIDLLLLHVLLLLDLRQDDEAARLARQLLYLDRQLAIGHFTLGVLQARQGDHAAARRAFRNTHALCQARRAEEVLPLAAGATASELAAAALAQLAMLERAEKAVTP